MSSKARKNTLVIVLVLASILVAYWFGNAAVSFKSPGYRFGGEQEGHPGISMLAHIAMFTVLASPVIGTRSIKKGYLYLGLHLVLLVISGFVVFWL